MSAKFKVGDKVRCIAKNLYGYVVGAEYDVVSAHGGTIRHPERPSGQWVFHACPFAEHHFDLATKPESELERLVRVANEGLVAIDKIYAEHKDEVEAGTPTRFESLHRILRQDGIRYRIKPKPAFEPFYVGPEEKDPGCMAQKPWLVKLEGDTLHVGCKKYLSAAVKSALTSVCRDGAQAFYGGTLTVGATRVGVHHQDGILTWADADRVLAALEKAGI